MSRIPIKTAIYNFDRANIFLCSESNKAGIIPSIKNITLYLFKNPTANTTAPIKIHCSFSVFRYLISTKYSVVQANTSKELGWYRVFNRNNTENNMQAAPKLKANKSPPSSSIAFQTISIVNAPYKAGKNFTQKTELPNNLIMYEVQEVNGGTDK
ncbi:MAG: hypothetical protein OHK0057_21810 [Thermoflexibacter sp.]